MRFAWIGKREKTYHVTLVDIGGVVTQYQSATATSRHEAERLAITVPYWAPWPRGAKAFPIGVLPNRLYRVGQK